jgi:hypothetical protein
MILFELRCGNEHQFEAWFKDGASYDKQAAAGVISCPHCGDTKVAKAPMAPRLARHHGAALEAKVAAAEMRRMLSDLRKSVEENCDYVGEKFADEARAIHYGDKEARPIYGEATPDDAKQLEEEGVAVQKIPWVPKGN